jgi:hypothetical protein
MLADAQTVEINEQVVPVGTTIRFGLHLGFRYSFMDADVLGQMFQFGGDTGDSVLRFLVIDDAGGTRQMYGVTTDDAIELTQKMVGAFPGYIERARRVLDDMEEAGVGN